MTDAEEVRAMWTRMHEEVATALRNSKQPHETVFQLSRRYRSLDLQARAVVDGILAEWVLSDDEATRFDALVLVDEYQVRSALPALRRLAARLEDSLSPGSPYEWAKVNRIIGALADGGDAP